MTRHDWLDLNPVPARFLRWFRGLSKPLQAVVGLPIVVGCLWVTWHELARARTPDEPEQAIWFTLLLFVATVLLSEYLRPKPEQEDSRPTGIGDFQFPTATEGRPVPLLWGRCPAKGPNVVWYGDFLQEAITEKVKTGLFSSTRVTKGFRYHLGVQFKLCRGPGVVLKAVHIGETEAFTGTVAGGAFFDIDDPEILGGDEFGAGGIQTTCDFYSGEKTQPVNAYLDTTARRRVATAITPTAPMETGSCHVVARQLTSAAPSATNRGAYLGNSTSIKPWEFELERFPGTFSGQTAGQNKIGTDDCNLVNVVYEVLTNKEWGFGFGDGDIDVGAGSTFVDASTSMIAEGNGFSMLLDRSMSARDLLGELQRQMDGVVYLDQTTGKWRIHLARGPSDARFGYDINTVPQFDDDSVDEVQDFTRGSWEDTTNQISVKFTKRADRYKESYALAQDMGAAIILSGGSTLNPVGVPGIVNFPGVKLPALAANLAWRELRGQAYPLARATFVTNRKFWQLRLGEVIAWTDADLGFSKLPMRVIRINYGTLTDNAMTVTAVQDVFAFAAASMGTPPPTGWTPPTTTLQDFPTAERGAIEAPRGIIVRDPAFAGDPTVGKVLCFARLQTNEVAFEIKQRNAPSGPSGAYTAAGDGVSFLRIGELTSALAAGTAIPTPTISIDGTPDSGAALEEVFDPGVTTLDLGVDLAHLVLVGTELMLVTSASIASDVDLENVYRGVLGTAQQNHIAGTDVFLLFVGAAMATTVFPNTNDVNIELRMRSALAVYAGAVVPIVLSLNRRALRPYPPCAVFYNGGAGRFGTPALEGDGSGLNGVGFDIDWHRSRFDATDEVAELLADDTVDASTEFRVTVFVDPDGINVQVFQSAWVTGTGPQLPTQVVIVNEAAAGTELRVQIESRHDIGAVSDLESDQDLIHDVVPTSARTSQVYLGGDLSSLVASNVYTVPSGDAGVHTVRIGAGYSTADVEIQVNSGGWSNVIAAGTGTSGTTASLSVGDQVELRVDANEAPARNFVEIENPSAADVAYGVFTDGT